MTALTTAVWFVGRVLRLDSLLLLFYPIPSMYIAARWGVKASDVSLFTTVLFIAITVGPFYAKSFVLNSALLAATYARGLWYGWPFWALLLAGACAKAMGLLIGLKWMSLILRYDAWVVVTQQTSGLLHAVVRGVNWVARRKLLHAPGMTAVKWGVGAVVVLHAVYHVFCTLLVATLLLRAAVKEGRLERVPPRVPGLEWLIQRSSRSKEM